jgi:UDP-glucose-4-epimerase GalE
MTNKVVVVTGAMGFIGSHTCKALKKHGYYVIGIDREFTIPQAAQFIDEFLIGDFVDLAAPIAANNQACAILHIAATSLVGPSIANPGLYYDNNVAKTNTMLQQIKENNWKGTVVFSSSAAVYGNGCITPIVEHARCDPVSPYGNSKFICEQLLNDHTKANLNINAIALRYFNAAGCDGEGKLGNAKHDTHLIPRIVECILTNTQFTLNGTDFTTPDGTCIRDYLHVTDIAEAHVRAINLAEFSSGFQAFNLGTGVGFSNFEVIKEVEKAMDKRLNLVNGPLREGDPDELIANPNKFIKAANWRPVHSSLTEIVSTTCKWMKNLDYSKE